MQQPLPLLLMVTLAGSMTCAQENPPQSKTVPDSINFIWKSIAKDFTRLADAMPEEKWGFKPTQGAFTNARTFAEQIKHVACANEAWAAQILKKSSPSAAISADQVPRNRKPSL